jgi:CubicO group peptidase (beta-lactamase class C family)
VTPELDRRPIDELVATFAGHHHCPSVVWGVVLDGRLSIVGAVGDVTERTIYRIASMTKSFSAAATLWLRDAGVVRLDDPVEVHAPELSGLRSPTDDAPKVTIRDLLSMTSGLATDDAWADRHLDLTDDEFDAIVHEGALFAVPTGTRFEYSNFGFALLGRVVQRASGRSIQDIVSTELLDPLGMSDTTWTQPLHDDWAPPMQWVEDRFVDELVPLGDGLIAPMGGIWTNVVDLARWVAWLDDAHPPRNDRDDGPLARSSRREMQTIQRYVGRRTLREISSPTGYGYGLRILDEANLGEVVSHSGGLPGYGSNMRWLRGRGVGAIALSNVTYAPMTELTARILDIVDEQGLAPRSRIAVSEHLGEAAVRLVALINDWDDAAASALFSDNVADDEPFARRRSAAAAYTDSGPLTLASLRPDNDASATIVCTDPGGAERTISFSLAPLLPPRVQEYELGGS